LQQFTFEQKKTKISELVDFVNALMSQARSTSSAHMSSTAQLLLIVSDGRGLFSEGSECVHQAIRRARQAGLFMVFVILDNPEGKDSILDIRVPIFDPSNGKLLGIKPYLDSFPFPFYVILRDIQTLPVVLSDALRQWFELVTSSSNV
jgi:midasin